MRFCATRDLFVLRRREAASKDGPGGANQHSDWSILRDAKLRFALRMRPWVARRDPKLPPGGAQRLVPATTDPAQFRVCFERFQWFAAPVPSPLAFFPFLLSSQRFAQRLFRKPRLLEMSFCKIVSHPRFGLSRNCRLRNRPPTSHEPGRKRPAIRSINSWATSRRRADFIGSATARPDFGDLKIVGQMHKIGAMAGLELADPVVDAQQSRRRQRRHHQRVGERNFRARSRHSRRRRAW